MAAVLLKLIVSKNLVDSYVNFYGCAGKYLPDVFWKLP
jgi:hypothetical protein